MRLSTPSTLIALLLSLTPLLAAAELSRVPHPHRRLDLSRRAGAAYNATETIAQSVILGRQVTSSAADVEPSSTQVEVTTSSTPALIPTTSSVADVAQTSSSVQQQSTQVAVTSSSVVSTTAVAVTSSSSVASDVVDTVTASATQSSIAPVTVTTTSSTPSSSSTLALPSTSTSTTTIAPQISTIKSTFIPPTTALPTSSAPNLVKSTATHSTATSSASAGAAEAAKTGNGKLSVGKTAMIAIIVVASVIIGALAIWTIIRKWKLGPSKKFDERMQPLDFSPYAGAPDPFLEKTRNRYSGGSLSEADRQRRQFVSELDADEQEKYAGGYQDRADDYLHGVPSHDFTPAEGGIASSNYSPPMGSYEPYGYAPQVQQDYTVRADETVGGTGYADLRRGPSTVGTNFAGMGAGAGGLQATSAPPVPAMPSQYHDDHEERMYGGSGSQEGHGSGLMREPSLGRPTKGEGPYFAASQFGQGQRY